MTQPRSAMAEPRSSVAPRLTVLLFGLAAIVAISAPARAADEQVASYETPQPVHKPAHKAAHKAVARPAAPADADQSHAKALVGKSQIGYASWYGKQFNKRKTASGEKFSPTLPTAAHRHLPIGTHLKVTNLQNGKETTVRINDRGPYAKGRILDLSQSAAKDIGLTHKGVAKVKIEVVGHDEEGATPAEKNAAVKQVSPADQTASAPAVPSAAKPVEVADSDALPQIGAGNHVEKSADGATRPALTVDHGAELTSRKRAGGRF